MKQPKNLSTLRSQVFRAKKLAGLTEEEKKALRDRENQKRKERYH